MGKLEKTVRRWVSEGKVEKAIEHLQGESALMSTEEKQELANLSRRWRSAVKKVLEEQSNAQEVEIEKNKITLALLKLSESIENSQKIGFNRSRRGLIAKIVAVLAAAFAGGYRFLFHDPDKQPVQSAGQQPKDSEKTPTAPKINIDGQNNTVIDMSGSKENTVNQNFYQTPPAKPDSNAIKPD